MQGNSYTHALISETIETPIGPLVLVADESGALCMAEFADCQHRMDRWLTRRFGPGRHDLRHGKVSDAVRDAFAAYFSGDITALLAIPVRFDGTAFQNEVWSALRGI